MSNSNCRFALFGEAPREWNEPGLAPDAQVFLRLASGEGFAVEVLNKSFRGRLLAGGQHWVYTGHVVREDAELLYGFESPAERALFLEFRELDSVGPKTAAQIVGGLERKQLSDLVHGKSLAGAKIPGLGPKTIEKIAAGVKSRREKFLAILGAMGETAPSVSSLPMDGEGAPEILVQGLEKLGLRRDDVQRLYQDLVQENPAHEQAAPSELIRLVLQRWGQHKSKIQAVRVEGHS